MYKAIPALSIQSSSARGLHHTERCSHERHKLIVHSVVKVSQRVEPLSLGRARVEQFDKGRSYLICANTQEPARSRGVPVGCA